MVLLLLMAAVIATSAATVCLATTRPRRESDPDAAFWYAFTGLCVLAPLTLGPALHSRAFSVVLLGVAAATALAAHWSLQRRRARDAATAERARTSAVVAQLAATHEALLARWSRYELDPAAVLDFPAMSDVRVPETAALIRAVRATNRAAQSVTGSAAPITADAVDEYRCTVAHLALALETAERAARVPAAAVVVD